MSVTSLAVRLPEPIAPPSHPLVLVCAADQRYTMPLAVMLYSALVNYRGSDPVEVYLLDGGIGDADRERIRALLARFGARLHWLVPRKDGLESLPTGQHFSESIYLRLLVPELLPREVVKAIYLDSDLLVQGDLGLLWHQEIGDRHLLAVRDPATGFRHLAPCPELTIEDEGRYFNSGVLVMNLARWREDDFGRRAIAFVRRWAGLIRYPDQDAMNALSIGTWGELDRAWNQCVASSVAVSHFELEPGGIVHFFGPVKAWHAETARFRQPAGVRAAHRAFERYARASGWYTPVDWWRFIVPLKLKRLYLGWVDLPLRVLALRLRAAPGRGGRD